MKPGGCPTAPSTRNTTIASIIPRRLLFGHLGHGFGVFFIPVSTESYAGGPLRQELAVHQDALILNYIGGGHFSGGGTAAGRTGQKIHGPWFLYFNTGDTPEAIIADAKKAAEAEQKKWPYQWVEEPLYPVKRTTVTGQLKISHDRSAAHAYIILGQPGNSGGRGGGGGGGGAAAASGGSAADRASVLYTQAGDYIFYVKADANGKFTLPAVRPGTYTLYAWQTQGPITQSFARDGVVVAGDTLDLGAVAWDPPWHPNLLWQIGQADRMAGEFKFGDQPRTSQWMLQVPANLTFTIGKSKEADRLVLRAEDRRLDREIQSRQDLFRQRLSHHCHRRRRRQGGGFHQRRRGRQPLLWRRRQRAPRGQPQRPLCPQRVHLSRLRLEAGREHPHPCQQWRRPDVRHPRPGSGLRDFLGTGGNSHSAGVRQNSSRRSHRLGRS